jgi:hypothetical protein
MRCVVSVEEERNAENRAVPELVQGRAGQLRDLAFAIVQRIGHLDRSPPQCGLAGASFSQTDWPRPEHFDELGLGPVAGP